MGVSIKSSYRAGMVPAVDRDGRHGRGLARLVLLLKLLISEGTKLGVSTGAPREDEGSQVVAGGLGEGEEG